MTQDIQAAGFPVFMALWNRQQGQTTPALHFRMAKWLEKAWTGEDGRRLLLMAFRSAGKSTVVGLFAAWLLYRRPDLRILVLAADLALARKMVRNVKRIIERHPLTRNLKPARLDQWGTERFTVNRALELRDPSMLAKGIAANITGSRADVVICDDVEVPNTSDTAGKREELRARLAEIEFVLVPGGLQLYAGTPHTWYSIYAEETRTETGEEKPFLEGFRRLTVPVLDKAGRSAWPERFSAGAIAHIRTQSGPNRFQSQMMLQSVNIAEGRLDPGKLHYYDDELTHSTELRRVFIGGRAMTQAAAWWDPSFGRQDNDRSVLAIVFTDEEGHYFVHRIAYIRVMPNSRDDEATQQCRAVAMLAREFRLPSVVVECNGIGRFLPGLLRREMEASRVKCAVVPAHNRRPKDIRIMEALDTLLAAEKLHLHRSVTKTPFIAEMQEWRPGGMGYDDGLDALAGAIGILPLRQGLPAKPARADTDFRIIG